MRTSKNDWERILVISDLHSTFLDRSCWNLFLGICKEHPVDRVIINGDFMDCTSISDHAKKINRLNPDVLKEYSFDYELHFVYEDILKPLRRAVGKAKIQLRLGNHEIRFLRPDRTNAHALAEIYDTCAKRNATRLEDLLKLDRVGATLSYNAVDTLYNTFTLIHGVKTGQGAAKANLLRYGSGTSGHSHRANSFTTVLHNRLEGWWESGCLRSLRNVEYLPHGDQPDWCNAFLSLTINKQNGHFFAKTHFIIDRECEYMGMIYR